MSLKYYNQAYYSYFPAGQTLRVFSLSIRDLKVEKFDAPQLLPPSRVLHVKPGQVVSHELNTEVDTVPGN